MASSEHLKALIKSYLEGDDSHFFSIAMQAAAHEAKMGRGKVAEELRALIDQAKLAKGQASANAIPIAKPRGELAGLLQVSYPKARLADMVLHDSVSKSLMRVIKEQRHNARLRNHGLAPRRKVLLVGPPGTGKTMTAAVLAGELGIPLLVVRLESLITKYLGETSAKLRQVFDAVGRTRGVYFFDEFDAIGGHRGLTNDVGEARRILNSFLSMIEQDESNSLIVAATNHPEILDVALFRRFDDVIEYTLPNTPQVHQILRARLGQFAPIDVDMASVAGNAEGLSHAEVVRAVDDAIKDAVMREQRSIDLAELGSMLRDRQKLRKRQKQLRQ